MLDCVGRQVKQQVIKGKGRWLVEKTGVGLVCTESEGEK